MRAFLILLPVGMLWSSPQRNAPVRRRQFSGQQFIKLLGEDYSEGDYDELVEDFQDFLRQRDLEARGDFIDFETLECTPKKGAYKVADPEQCDKYWECSIRGQLTEKLCKDGLVYDVPGKSCNYPERVECGERTELQEPKPTRDCPRQNGFFYFPDEPERCNEYVDCTDGIGQPGLCSTGVVWSPAALACTVPAQSGREECVQAALKNREFVCPTTQGPLRFGNHDRLRNPKDCGKFYICLSTGQANPASCDKPLAFDESIGACKPPEEVEGCEDFGKQEED